MIDIDIKIYRFLNYDEDDFARERTELIQEFQQKVWDLWTWRYQCQDHDLSSHAVKAEIAEIVEDWTGHDFQLPIEIKRPEENIPF